MIGVSRMVKPDATIESRRANKLGQRLRSLPVQLAIFCCLIGLVGIAWGYRQYRISGVVILAGDQTLHSALSTNSQFSLGLPYKVTPLPPGVAFERCLTLFPSDGLAYSFKTDQPVVFDLHYHRGSKLVYAWYKEAVSSGAGRYDATTSQEYCLTWHNTSREAIQLSWHYQALPRAD